MRPVLLLAALLLGLSLAPQVAAAPPLHGLGAVVSGAVSVAPARLLDASATLPAAVDLSADAPPPGDQGSVNACVSWVTGYTLLGWYAQHVGLRGAPYAPMYVYSQVTGGQNVGTSFEGNLGLEQAQGIDTQADYTQGNDDYTDLPTPTEMANAAQYHVTGWQQILGSGASNQEVIESALAAGMPVGLGVQVYTNFYNADASSAVIGPPGSADTYVGSHAVAVLGYTDQGIRIENQWGTGWGDGGYATLTWDFVNTEVWGAYVITGFSAPSALPPTAIPTAIPAAIPTAADTGTPTETATTVPSATATAAPPLAPSATATASPMATLTSLPSATSTAPPSATATTSPLPMATATSTPSPTPSATALAAPTASVTPAASSSPAATATPRPRRHPLRTLLFWRWVWTWGVVRFVGVHVAAQ